MLVMPFNFDQPDNAFRAVHLGVGRSLSRSAYRAARAARELNELLNNPSYRENSSRISSLVQQEKGAETASDAVEALLRN
jgi:UDP:flavonoid glycosyltransferase YjiC (YdhE family)